jgi:hypothetical protein
VIFVSLAFTITFFHSTSFLLAAYLIARRKTGPLASTARIGTVLIDIHIQHNRPDIIILNKQQKQAYLLDIAVPNSHNITQTYNTKINKYLELSVAMRNLWCLEKISILPFIMSATGIVPQSLFKNLKILDNAGTIAIGLWFSTFLISFFVNWHDFTFL